MRSEKALWQNLKQKLPTGSYQRHEDKLGLGILDVSYAFRHDSRRYSGWIELKEAEPVIRKAIGVGLSPEQYGWMFDRGLHGGDCWLLVQIDYYYWYYWGDLLDIDVNELTLSQHKKWSRFYFERLQTDQIIEVLTSTL